MGLVIAFFVAAAVVTLLQYIRLREKRLLPLLSLFALLALAHSLDDPYAARWLLVAAGVAGLVLLVVLSARQPAGR